MQPKTSTRVPRASPARTSMIGRPSAERPRRTGAAAAAGALAARATAARMILRTTATTIASGLHLLLQLARRTLRRSGLRFNEFEPPAGPRRSATARSREAARARARPGALPCRRDQVGLGEDER